MKLHLTQDAESNLVTGYGENWVELNSQRYTSSLIVMSDRIISNWQVADFASLTPEHFEKLAVLKPEVVILGTGKKHQFIHPRLCRSLAEIGIGVECMDTAAACRTYNFLVAEARKVIAALII